MQETLYFTSMMRRRVMDSAGHGLGTVVDMVAGSGDLFPRIKGLVLKAPHSPARLYVALDWIADLGSDPIQLKPDAPDLAPLQIGDSETRLGHAFMDRQVVDVQGIRVVRVNDLKLARVNHEVRLLGADVGAAGLFRRMRAEAPLRWLAGPLGLAHVDTVIPWSYVDPLSDNQIQLNITRGRVRDLRPADLADVIEQLPKDARTEALTSLSDEQIADALSEVRLDVQRSILEQMADDRASDIVEQMAPDDAADLLQTLNAGHREDILEHMDAGDRRELSELLAYRADSAGGLMTTAMVTLRDGQTAQQAIESVRNLNPDAETIYYLYLVDGDGKLEGVVSLRALVTARPDEPVSALAAPRLHLVHVDDDQEQVARVIAHYNLLAVPVVDDKGVLKGIVTVDDVMDVLAEEAAGDMAVAAGSTPPALNSSWSDYQRPGWVAVAALIATTLGLIALRILTSTGPAGLAGILLPMPLVVEGCCYLSHRAFRAVTRRLTPFPGTPPARQARGILFAGPGSAGADLGVAAILAVLLALSGCALSWVAPAIPPSVGADIPLAILGAGIWAIVCGALLPLAYSRSRPKSAMTLQPTVSLLASGGGIVIYTLLLRTLAG